MGKKEALKQLVGNGPHYRDLTLGFNAGVAWTLEQVGRCNSCAGCKYRFTAIKGKCGFDIAWQPSEEVSRPI